MRIGLCLLALVVASRLYAAEAKKFRYICGYNDVTILKVDRRGIQVMHSDGICYLNPDDFTATDKKLLASELAAVEASKKAYADAQAKLKKQKSIEAKNTRIAKAAQSKKQVEEVKEMIEKYGEMPCYKILIDMEKKFGIEKNRNMGLRGRVNALTKRINKDYPLASNRRNLIKILNDKRKAVEDEKKAALKAKKEAEEAKKEAEEAEKK